MAEIMDESNILTPQFMAPVAIVMIGCIFVFIFGFRQVSEPNFNFTPADPEKKKRTTKPKKGKQHTNGHIAYTEPNQSAISEVADKPPVKAKEQPKPSKTKKALPSQSVKSEVQVVREETSDASNEGWTTATFKKTKKKKVENPDIVISSGEVGSVKSNDEAPSSESTPTKQTKKDKKKNVQKEAPKEASKEVPKEVPKEAPTKVVESIAPKEKEQPTPKTVVNQVKEETTTATVEQTASPSTKKNKKKKKAEEKKEPTVADDDKSENKKEVDPAQARLEETKLQQKASSKGKKQEVTSVKAEPTIEMQIADAMEESPQPSPVNDKPNESPTRKNSKKKSKSANKEQSKSSPASSQDVASHQNAAGETKVAAQTSDQSGAAKPAAKEVSEQKKDQPTHEDTQDGDWEEAKVPKKRKKARRDN